MPNTKSAAAGSGENSKAPATDNGSVDIFARGEFANMLKDATSKTAVGEPVVAKSAPVAPPKQRTTTKPASAASKASKPKPAQNKAPVVISEPSGKNVPLRFRIPTELKGEWSNFTGELEAALGGVSLDDSNLGRPLLELLLVDYREQILEQAAELEGKLKRPSLSDRLAMAEFDAEIGQMLKSAIRQRRKKAVATE